MLFVCIFISSSRAAWHWHTIPLRCRMGTWILLFQNYNSLQPPCFTFEFEFPGKYLQTLSDPHLFINVYQTETFFTGGRAKIGEPSASICTRALSCKWAGIFKQLQDMRAINTHPLSYPGVSFHSCLHYHVWLMQTEHLFMHLCIRPVRHVPSDCTQGKLGYVTVSL